MALLMLVPVKSATHALAKKDARPDKIQRWADHKDSRTTQRYNRRKELLDDSPGYGLASDVAGALDVLGRHVGDT